MTDVKKDLYVEIADERFHQDKKWGGPDHDSHHTSFEWVGFITHYLGKSIECIINNAGKEEHQLLLFRYNMIKVAALAVAAVEAVDRKLKSS